MANGQDNISKSIFEIIQEQSDTSSPTVSKNTEQNWNVDATGYGDKRSLWDQLGRAAWLGSEEFLTQGTLGFFPEQTDITDYQAETFVEKVGAGVGGALGFMVPFLLTRGAGNMAARGAAGRASTTRLSRDIGVKTMDDVGAASKNARASAKAFNKKKGSFTYDPKRFQNEEQAINYFKQGFSKGEMGNKIKHFEHGFKNLAEKKKFARMMEGLDGGMGRHAQRWARKHGLEIDDRLMRKISRTARDHWKAANGRPVGSMTDLFAKKMPILGRDTKSAAWAAALTEEVLLFNAVENVAHSAQVMHGNVEGGWDGYWDTIKHATLLGTGLGLVRSIMPGGVRGGVFSFMRGGADDVNKLINSTESFAQSLTTGANTKIGAKQLYKKYGNTQVKSDISPIKGKGKHDIEATNREAINSMYGDIARVKDNLLNPTRGKNMDSEMQHIIQKSPWFKSFQKLFKGDSGGNLSHSRLSEIVKQYRIDKYATYSREQQIAAAELMKYGLKHTGLQVRTKWRKEFLKTFKADLFGGKIGPEGSEEAIKGAWKRMLVGGTLMSAETMFHPDVPVEDKFIHFFIGAFMMKGGKELQWRNKGGKMYEWNQYERMSPFPEHVKSLSAMSDAAGAPIWSTEWRALRDKYDIEGTDIYHYSQSIPKDLKPIKPYIDAIDTKVKGQFAFRTNNKDVMVIQEPKKVDESIYKPIYDDWRRKMGVELLLRDSGKPLIPENQRIKEWDELTPLEAKRFVKLMDKSKTSSLLDLFSRWEKATLEPAHKSFVKVGEELSHVVETLKQDGKRLPLVDLHIKSGTGESEYRYAPIDYSDLNFAKHGNLIELMQQYNAIIEMRHTLGFVTESSKLDAVKLNDKTQGLETFGDSMSRVLTNFSNEMFRFGIKKQADFTNHLWRDMYHHYYRQKSVHKFMETLIKMSKETRDSDTIGAKDNEALKLLKEIIETEDGGFVKPDILITDLKGNPKRRDAQNMFLEALQTNWRNFKPIQTIQDTQTRSEQMNRKVTKVSNKDIDALMNHFRTKDVTIFHSAKKQELEAFGNFTNLMLSHQVLKNAYFVGNRDSDGNVTGVKRVDAKVISTINTLRSLRVADSNFQVIPIVDVWMRQWVRRVENIKTKDIDAPYMRIEKLLEGDISLEEAKKIYNEQEIKLLKDGKIKETSTEKEIDALFESYNILVENSTSKDMTKKLNAVQEMIGDLLEREVDIVSYDKQGNKTVKKQTVGILRQSNRLQLEAMPGQIDYLFELLTQISQNNYTDSTKGFLKSMKQYTKFDNEVGSLAKIITNRFISSNNDAVRLMAIATDAKSWDYRSNQFVWEKEGFKTEDQQVKIVNHLRNMLEMNKNRFTESHLSIKHRIERLERLEADEELPSVNKVDLGTILALKSSKEWENLSRFPSDREMINSLAYNTYGFGAKNKKNVKIKEMIQDWTDNLKMNNPEVVQRKGEDYIEGLVQKVVTDLRGAEEVTTLEIDLSNIKAMGKDTTVIQKNQTYNYLKEMTRDMRDDADTGQIFLISSNSRNQRGRNGLLSNSETWAKTKEILFKAEANFIDKRPVSDDIGPFTHLNDSFIMVRTNPNKDYAWAIRNDLIIWNSIINKYAELVKSKKRDVENELDIALSEAPELRKKIILNKKGKYELLELSTDPITATDAMRGLTLSYIRAKIKGDRFFKENRLDISERIMAEEEARMKLFENVSGKFISEADLPQYIDFWSNNQRWTSKSEANVKIVKTLENLRDGKIKKIVIEDEGFTKVHKLFSLMERELENIGKAKDEVRNHILEQRPDKTKLSEGTDLEILVSTNADYKALVARERIIKELYKDKDDVATSDSMTMISNNLFNSLNHVAFGTTAKESTQYGGIKTILTKSNGVDKFSMYKSILQKNSEFAEYFKDGVEMITFTSSSKKLQGKYGDNYKLNQFTELGEDFKLEPNNIKDFYSQMLAPERIKDLTETVNISDLQFIYQKGPKDKAAIAPNFDVGIINKTAAKDWYNMIYDGKIKKGAEDASKVTDPMRMEEAIAMFEMAFKEDKHVNADIPLDNTNQGIMNLISRNGGHPLMLGKQGVEVLYSNMFEGVDKPTVPGAQSVFSFDAFNNLKGTIKLDGKIWQVGEMLAPHSLGEVKFSNEGIFKFDKLTFTKENKFGADEIIYASDKKAMNKHGITEPTGKRIKDLVEHLQNTVGEEYSLIVWNHREPHVKDASIVPLRIKGFKKERDGNQVEVNALDGIEHLEFDFDGDTGNMFIHMPKSTSTEAIKLAGKSGKTQVFPHEGNGTQAAYIGLNLKKDVDMAKYSERQDIASKLRGTSMMMQHISKWYRTYKSPDADKWKEWDGEKLVDGDGGILIKVAANEYVGIRKNWDAGDVMNRYIQSAVDTAKGTWDLVKLRDKNTVMRDILFNTEYGLFVRKRPVEIKEGRVQSKDWIDKDRETISKLVESNQIALRENRVELSESTQGMLLKLTNIRNRFLGQKKNTYNARGDKRKVSYQDRVFNFYNYLYEMKKFQGDDVIRSLKEEGNIKQEVNILHGWIEATDLSSGKTSNKLETIDRIERELVKNIKPWWDHYDYQNFHNEVRYKDIKNISDLSTKDIMQQDIFKEFQKSFISVSEQGKFIERTQNFIEMLERKFNMQSNPESRNARYYRREIDLLKNKLELYTSKYKDFLIDKGTKRINPKIQEFENNVKEEIKRQVINEHFEKSNNYPGEKELQAKIDERFKELNWSVVPVSNRDMMEAIVATRAYANVVISNPESLNMPIETYTKMSKDIIQFKKEFNKDILNWKEGKPLQISKHEKGEIPDRYNVPTIDYLYTGYLQKFNSIMLNYTGGARWETGGQGFEMTNLLLVKLMVPEASLKKFASYRGELMPAPKYDNFHHFVKFGFRYVNEYFPSNAMKDAIVKPYIREYNSQIRNELGMTREKEQIFADEQRKKNAGDQDGFSNPLTYGMGHTSKDLLEYMVPSAQNLYGKPMSQLDAYQSNFLLFGSGILPRLLNESRFTTLPYKTFTEASRWSGEDYYLGGPSSLFNAMQKRGTNFLVHDKWRRSYASVLGENNYSTDTGKDYSNFGKEKSFEETGDNKFDKNIEIEYDNKTNKEGDCAG